MDINYVVGERWWPRRQKHINVEISSLDTTSSDESMDLLHEDMEVDHSDNDSFHLVEVHQLDEEELHGLSYSPDSYYNEVGDSKGKRPFQDNTPMLTGFNISIQNIHFEV